ncbi:MAG TPA: glycosyltransferase [Solirubrobacteraceae bacterium]|nr:glycosyltransferase [Solirubrobacteraceae bacterium]
MKRLLLVTQRPLEYGGGGSVRWQYLRDALPRHGWAVEVVSARPNPTANAAATDPRAARLAAARAKVMTAVGAATRPAYRRLGLQPEAFPPNALWSLTGRPAVRRMSERVRPDVVWATCPPPSALFAALGGVDAATPFVAEMRDLWAGNPYFDAGGTLLTRIEKRAFARAAAIVTVTDSCADRMRALHPEIASRLHVLPNGFDPVLLELRRPPRAAGERTTLVHAGTLYGDRSAVTLMRALSRPELAGRTRLELVGAVDPQTTAELRHARCEVVVEPPTSWRAAVERVRDADIAVVINSPGTGGDMAAPSKLYEALVLGTPVLALTGPGSETERLLQRLGHDAGCATPGDEDAVANTVARLLDAPPAAVDPAALAPFSRETVAGQLAQLLDGLAAS